MNKPVTPNAHESNCEKCDHDCDNCEKAAKNREVLSRFLGKDAVEKIEEQMKSLRDKFQNPEVFNAETGLFRSVNKGCTLQELKAYLSCYEDYEVDSPGGCEDAVWYCFLNGYGVSVVRNAFTHGGSEGLWEMMMLKTDCGKWDLLHDNPHKEIMAEDAVGYLEPKDVKEIIEKVVKL